MTTAAAHRPPTSPYADREPTKPPDWHGLVVWDLFFNAVTTGLFLVAASCDLARPGLFAPVAAWAYPVALVVLLVDLLCLVLDLGDPLRFHHMLRVFKPSSPMSLGTWCLTAYSFPLTAVVALQVVGWLGWADVPRGLHVGLLVVGLLPALGSGVYKGVLFSTSSQPGWRDARWLGAYHAASAVTLGAVGLLALATVAGHGDAAAALRPAAMALLVLAAIPLAFLGGELGPALERRYHRSELWLAVALSGGLGLLFPACLLAVGGGSGLVTAAEACAFAGAWVARSVIVKLPHRHVITG